MKTFPMPFLLSILFSINREEVFWGSCNETFQGKAHVGRGNAMCQSKKCSIVLAKQSAKGQGTSFASPSSAGPSAGRMWCSGKALLNG